MYTPSVCLEDNVSDITILTFNTCGQLFQITAFINQNILSLKVDKVLFTQNNSLIRAVY